MTITKNCIAAGVDNAAGRGKSTWLLPPMAAAAILLILFIRLAPGAAAADFTVQSVNGVPQLCMDGTPVHKRTFFVQMMRLVMPQFKFQSPGPHEVKLAGEAGVRIISFKFEGLWLEPGKDAEEQAQAHFQKLDTICDAIIKELPDAQLLVRVGVAAPQWWLDAHPDDVIRFADGEAGQYACPASEKYRKDAGEALRRVIRHVEKRYPGHVIGYHPAGPGYGGEWFHNACFTRKLFGYSRANRDGFRRFLTQKYGDDAALQKAWGKADASLSTAEIPSPEGRAGIVEAPLREPARDMELIDFVEYHNDAMADAMLSLAKIIRQECGKSRLSVAFYGYVFQLSPVWNGPGDSGHLALRKVLSSPDIDVLCSPFCYTDRHLGGTCQATSPADSVMLAGKLWLNEDDTSTDIATAKGNKAAGAETGAKDRPDTLRLLRRNLAFNYSHDFAIWWMDLIGNGWFDTPEYWAEMAKFAPIEERQLRDPQPYRPAIAFATDPRSLRHFISCGSALWSVGKSLSGIRCNLSGIGASYGQYLLDDLLEGKVQAQYNVFGGIFALDGKQRRAIRELTRSSATVFLWGSAYIDLDTGKFSLDAVEEATGFKVKLAGPEATLQAYATEYGKTRLGLPAAFGRKERVTPLLSPIPQDGDRILAVYADGSPAMVLRFNGKEPSLFCGISEPPLQILRTVAKHKRMHLYSEPYSRVFANDNFVSIVAPRAAEYTINCGKAGDYTDLITGKSLGTGPLLKVKLEKGDVVVIPLAK